MGTRRWREQILALTAALLLWGVPAVVFAQQGEPAEGGASATESPDDASEEVRAKLAELDALLEKVRASTAEWAARANGFAETREAAPTRLAALEAEIKALEAEEPTSNPDATADELEAQLLDAEQNLALTRKEALDLEAEAADRPDRRRRIPELLAEAKERQKRLADEPVAPSGVAPALLETRKRLAKARAEAIQREIDAYQAELISFDVRGQLLNKRLDRAVQLIAREEARIEMLRQAAAETAQAQAIRDAERSRRNAMEAASMPSTLKELALDLANENQALAAERAGKKGLPQKIDAVRRKLARADERVAKLDADYERLVQKVEAAGQSDSVGLLLRKQRSEAPDTGKYRRFIRMRQELISSVQLEQIERREQRRQLGNIDRVVANAMSQLDESVTEEDRARIELVLRDLLETKRQYLDSLISDYEVYFQKLVDFDARQQQLIEQTEELLQFIDERVLWIPSGEAMRPTLLSDAWGALTWLFTPRYGEQLLRAVGDVITRAPLINAVALLFASALFYLRRSCRTRLTSLGEKARAHTCTRDGLTWEAGGLTLLLAAWWPGLLGFVGWQLSVSPDATQFVRCIANGAVSAALVWLSLEVPRQLLRPAGLVEAHFGAPTEAVRSLRDRLLWMTAIAVPGAFIVQVFELRAEDAWRESLGRLVFVAVMLAATFFLHGALREKQGTVWSVAKQSHQRGIRRWVRRLAHVAAVGAALLLAAAALRGYYFTAYKLAGSFLFTLVFLFLLLVVFRLGVRWSMLARRRLAIEQLASAQETKPPDAEYDGLSVETEVDLEVVDAQTSRLIRSATVVAFLVGMWLIWADLLPAVGILRKVELWSTTQAVTVETTNAAGERSLLVEDRVLPVTLADLLLALILAGMSLVVVRNLPGFLEITIFHRLAPGERYAYATLAKYGISLAGIAVVFNAVGVGWSNIQWLVAAVGLGLGFGLQEIFANFISGLIILFERPIRVGDTVTVGNISGVVSRIRIRATWITGFDRKELVVPNKEFVTNQLVNWSLSDAISRVAIKVGIAYGSDTERAIALLNEIAERNPDVLPDPAPAVLFLGFGESSLDFELRVFSPDVDRRLPIIHALHMAIDAAFREAEIEIAFPQRDLHVR